jgi:hypothetical protein
MVAYGRWGVMHGRHGLAPSVRAREPGAGQAAGLAEEGGLLQTVNTLNGEERSQ